MLCVFSLFANVMRSRGFASNPIDFEAIDVQQENAENMDYYNYSRERLKELDEKYRHYSSILSSKPARFALSNRLCKISYKPVLLIIPCIIVFMLSIFYVIPSFTPSYFIMLSDMIIDIGITSEEQRLIEPNTYFYNSMQFEDKQGRINTFLFSRKPNLTEIFVSYLIHHG